MDIIWKFRPKGSWCWIFCPTVWSLIISNPFLKPELLSWYVYHPFHILKKKWRSPLFNTTNSWTFGGIHNGAKTYWRDVVCATRSTTQAKYVNPMLPYLDYNDLGTTITTCWLFTNSSVDNHQSRRQHVY